MLALLVVDPFSSAVSRSTRGKVIGAAAVLAIVNAYIRPLVIILTLPINILTLGLFTSSSMPLLTFVAWLISGFHIATFWTALGATLIIGIISTILNWFLKPGRRVEVRIDRH